MIEPDVKLERLDMPSIHALCFAEQLALAAAAALRVDEVDPDDPPASWWDR